jgi:hypothetical protein
MDELLSCYSNFDFLRDYFYVTEKKTKENGLISLIINKQNQYGDCELTIDDYFIISHGGIKKRLIGAVTKERLIDEIESVLFIVSSFDDHNFKNHDGY